MFETAVHLIAMDIVLVSMVGMLIGAWTTMIAFQTMLVGTFAKMIDSKGAMV